MSLHIGQAVGWERVELWSSGEPRWHCLLVPAGKEPAWRDLLGRRMVSATYPERVIAGRRRDGSTVVRRRPDVPGYLFARFPGPVRWHALGRSPLPWRVLARDGWPVHLSEEVVLGMDALPEAAALKAAQERARAEEVARRQAEAERLREGGRARVERGALAGRTVEVVELTGEVGQRMAHIMLLGDALLGRSELDYPADALRSIDDRAQGE